MRADSYRFPSPSAYFTLVKLTFSKILFNSIAVRERHLQKRLVKLILFLANVQKRLVKLTPFFANAHFPLVKLTLFLANVQKRLVKLTLFLVTFQKAQFLPYKIVLFSSRWLQPSKQPSALWFQSSPSRTTLLRAAAYRFPPPSAYFTLAKLTFSKILCNSIAVRERHLQKRLVKFTFFLQMCKNTS